MSWAGLKWLFQKLDDMIGCPALFVKTSPSGPGSAKRSTCSARIAAVDGVIVIDRSDAEVFSSLRSHSFVSRRTSWSVTRTLR